MSIHAERGPEVRHPGTGVLLVLITALASTAVLVLAITGSFDGSSTGSNVSSPAVSGVRAGGGPGEGTRRIDGASTQPAGARIGVRGVVLPAAGASAQPAAARIGVRGVVLPAAGASAQPAATRIGVRGVVLPAAGASAQPAATRIEVPGVVLPAAGQPGGRANPAPTASDGIYGRYFAKPYPRQ